eukprot:2135232-Ditylum_brightwellii.AAC.1
MTNTNHDIPYQEYEPPPIQVPVHMKTTEYTPPPRVEKQQPNIIHDENGTTPQPPRVPAPNPDGPH